MFSKSKWKNSSAWDTPSLTLIDKEKTSDALISAYTMNPPRDTVQDNRHASQ